MTPASSAAQIMQKARAGMRRSAINRELHLVAAGKRHTLSLDLLTREGLADVLERVTSRMAPDSPPMKRILHAFERSGLIDSAIDGLASRNPEQRATSARVVGALRLEQAVPYVAPLVASRERSVSNAAARALGRIGGARSADALLLAIQRLGLRTNLILELARSAPDLFLEVALIAEQRPGVRSAVAIAAGLRRRHTAAGPLMAMLMSGTRRQRVISCRTLGWIGAGTAVPVLTNALDDREWSVRMSAAKALVALHAQTNRDRVEMLLADRNPRVRKAGQYLLRG